MTLTAGTRLGPYEISSPLGAGGMGEVYRARDTRLGRDVAIKVLPAELLTDEERRRRFIQEARAASALSHPHIVIIHEIESADGMDFIVMEYVAGNTLDTLIRPGLRLSEALGIAISIADALAAAHAAGIVHRDLKPSNVIVTPEGQVKVLDFGLAKLVAPTEASAESDTRTMDTSPALSRPGSVSGTPAYMSPEQSTGGRVDSRSDIFAFGTLLYEMVTRRRAFAGESAAETRAAVVRDQPRAASELVPGVPADLDKLIRRCLRKDPDRRFQHMTDVKVELVEIKEESDAGATIAGSTRPSRGLRAAWVAGALAAVVGAGVALGIAHRSGPSDRPTSRIVPLTTTRGLESSPTFSPDGNQFAFSWEGENTPEGEVSHRSIWLKLIDSSETRQLTSSPANDFWPAWSPDGRQIAFIRLRPEDTAGTIHLVSPLGGADRKLGDFPAALSQLAWSPDGRWLAAPRARKADETAPEAGGIHVIAVDGTQPERALTRPPPPGYDVHPAFSPDGTHLAYVACERDRAAPCDVEVVDLGAGFAPSGPPRRLTRQRMQSFGLAWTRDGTSIVYSAGHLRPTVARLWRVGVDGKSPPERLEFVPEGTVTPVTVASRDRLAYAEDRSDSDIYRFEAGRPVTAVVATSAADYSASFSPDGRRFAFESGRSGDTHEIWLASADGSNPQQVTHGPGFWQGSPQFSPDGRRIVFESWGPDGWADVWTIDADGGSLRRVTHGPFHEGLASWSHDGRWIYYRGEHDRGRDISRVPAAGGAPARLTHGGGMVARESFDGKTLFYTQSDLNSPLLALSLTDGTQRPVVECVQGRSLAIGPDGVYYLGCPLEGRGDLRVVGGAPPNAPLYVLDPATGRTRVLGTVPTGGNLVYLSVSPDAKTILFSKSAAKGDLFMVENFR